jgi:hypothetical protein
VLKTLARRWLVAAISLSAAAVLFTGQVRFEYMYLGRDLSWARAFAVSLADWEVWTLLAPAVLALAARMPVSRARLLPALAAHIPASLLLSAIKRSPRRGSCAIVGGDARRRRHRGRRC